MAYYTGTLLASPIVRGSSGDTYGTHHSTLGIGGYMEVTDLTKRNLIPVDSVNGIGFDGISSGQRRIGMLVYVQSEDTIYQLKISESTWSGLTVNQKVNALANNTNWSVFISGVDGSSGDKIFKEFQQNGHGFVIGDVIGFNGTLFLKVNTTTAGSIEPLGVVSRVIDVNSFVVTFSGYIPTTGIVDVNSNTLSGGTVYYLSSTAGKLSPTAPTSSSELSKPMLATISGNTGVVLQYRGLYETTASGGTVSYPVFTGYTATTQVYLDKTVTGATNIGFFSGTTAKQTLPINHLTDNSFDGNYVSLYNNYYRDSLGFIRIGVPSDGIPKRGYVRSTSPIKSWIWNEYVGQSNPLGWVFINADISSDSVYDQKLTGSTYIKYESPVYSVTGWTESQFYNNGSPIVINNVIGNLTTGTTYNITGPIFNNKEDKNLRLRTLVSETPNLLRIKYDDYYIKLSGLTSLDDIQNVGDDSVGIFSGKSNSIGYLKSLIGGGSTTITDEGDRIRISSTVSGTSTASGENITRSITKVTHGFALGDVVGWSGGTYNKAIADGSYGGEIIGIVTKITNPDNFSLTQSGYVTGFTGLITNSTYYVSPLSAGAITTVKPTTIGHYVRPIFATNSTTSGWVLPYDGYVVTSADTNIIIYTGKTPSSVQVGGMSIGTTLTGKTIQKILEEILVPTVNPTFVAPSNGFLMSPSTTTYEVGVEIASLMFTSSFNRGAINISSVFQDYRSGLPNTYNYTGTDLPTTESSSGLTDIQTITGYTVSAGTQSWTSSVTYDEGPQPLDSNGDSYSSPLSSGTTGVVTRTITGIYPYFWGKVSSGGAASGDNRPTSDIDLITGGTKVVSSSNGTITINFNSTSDDYLWFAIPTGSTLKTEWFVNSLNTGDIGGVVTSGGNLFPDPDVVSVTTDNWSGVPYNVYVSNYQTGISSNMELRN
jgi:hypothetical protein